MSKDNSINCPRQYLKLRAKLAECIQLSIVPGRVVKFKRGLSLHLRSHYLDLFQQVEIVQPGNHGCKTFDLPKLIQLLGLPYTGECQTCGGPTEYSPKYYGPPKFCSNSCIGMSPEVRLKKANTSILHFGVEHPLQSVELRKRSRENYKKKHGVDHPMKTAAGKAHYKLTLLRKFGVENVMQRPEVFEKAKHSHRRRKTFRSANGLDFVCQGYEPQVIDFLDKHPNVKRFTTRTPGMPVVPYKFKGMARRYFPDIFVRLKDGRKLVVEVKSNYTIGLDKTDVLAMNLKKFKAAHKFCKDNGAYFWIALVDKGEIQWMTYPKVQNLFR